MASAQPLHILRNILMTHVKYLLIYGSVYRPAFNVSRCTMVSPMKGNTQTHGKKFPLPLLVASCMAHQSKCAVAHCSFHKGWAKVPATCLCIPFIALTVVLALQISHSVIFAYIIGIIFAKKKNGLGTAGCHLAAFQLQVLCRSQRQNTAFAGKG